MIIQRICKHCGNAFTPNEPGQKYCSLKCKEAQYKSDIQRYERAKARRTSKPRECSICGKLFIPTTNAQKTCSPECATERKKQKRIEQSEAQPKRKRTKRGWKDHATCKRYDCLWHNYESSSQWCSCLYCFYTGKPRKPVGTTWRECIEYITESEAKERGIHKSYTDDMQNVVYATDESDLDEELKAYRDKHRYKVNYFGEDDED